MIDLTRFLKVPYQSPEGIKGEKEHFLRRREISIQEGKKGKRQSREKKRERQSKLSKKPWAPKTSWGEKTLLGGKKKQ